MVKKTKKTNLLSVICYLLSESTGFSLIELVIVMMILSVVSAAIWGNFLPSLTKGRDVRRKQDLDAISKALELYYTDNKSYPTPPLPDPGTNFTHPDDTSVIYMSKLPQDPSYPNATYCYTADSNGFYFKLYTNLENRNDPKIFITPVLCNTVYYNYGISSVNTTP